MTEVARYDPEAAIPAQAPASNILSVIERIAMDPNVDVERMQALLRMRADEEERTRRMDREDRADEAKRAWLRDFAKVQAEIGPIVRGRANDHTRSRYADLADIDRIVTPVLTKHGFSTTTTPLPCEVPDHIRMRLTIGHADGHERSYEDDFPLDAAGSQGKTNKTPIQAKGSTETYARRYLKASALDLAFMDDRDGNAPKGPADPNITEDQYVELQGLIDAAGVKEQVILDAANIAALHFLPQSKLPSMVKRLNATIKARETQE